VTILDEIVQHKRKEVEQAKKHTPVKELESSPFFDRKPLSLSAHLLDPQKSGIIAEFKRKSPSKGIINANAEVAAVTQGYAAAGASGISVLTDEPYFSGHRQDLITARQHNEIPILRKDFMIDEFQVLEAKAMGADVILLIAANLEKKQANDLAQLAQSLGLELLLEVHSAEELEWMNPHVNIVGVNNRNLKTFEVSIDTSLQLLEQLPQETIKISESGISAPETIKLLKQHGFQGFLIGENFMKTTDPAQACIDFINQL